MPSFCKKPVEIEARQWWPPVGLEHFPEVERFYPPVTETLDPWACKNACGGNNKVDNHGWVPTLEGGHIVCPGDYIITGVQGEKYPCKPDIFEATYTDRATMHKMIRGFLMVKDGLPKSVAEADPANMKVDVTDFQQVVDRYGRHADDLIDKLQE